MSAPLRAGSPQGGGVPPSSSRYHVATGLNLEGHASGLPTVASPSGGARCAPHSVQRLAPRPGGPGGEAEEERAPGVLARRIVVDPPNLAAWREKLFNVDEEIVLTHDQFETYFPHVDNVYSHRSTQRYKRKPFTSHYWDCRMKGRPPGTPKSTDPGKPKRKRVARERGLCDVKIKITEHVPEAAGPGGAPRFWTIERVNGNGGNGKGDGAAGPHKHTLAMSDEIKKNSVQRHVEQLEREERKRRRRLQHRATGAALETVKRHSKDNELKLYAACFCPFSQRVWIALEAKGICYQYCETDRNNGRRAAAAEVEEDEDRLEPDPRNRVPAIRQGDWVCAESSVILEYGGNLQLEDLDGTVPLMPADARLKAKARLWVDWINRRIVPVFFGLLRAADRASQSQWAHWLQAHITTLVRAADEEGPFFFGRRLSLVDVHLAPFALRLGRLLGWPVPTHGTRWYRWVEALEADAHVRATTSDARLYGDTVEALVTMPAHHSPRV